VYSDSLLVLPQAGRYWEDGGGGADARGSCGVLCVWEGGCCGQRWVHWTR